MRAIVMLSGGYGSAGMRPERRSQGPECRGRRKAALDGSHSGEKAKNPREMGAGQRLMVSESREDTITVLMCSFRLGHSWPEAAKEARRFCRNDGTRDHEKLAVAPPAYLE